MKEGAFEAALGGSAVVQLRGDRITVKELTWKAYISAVKQLTGTILQFVGSDGNTITLTKDTLLNAISEQEGLIETLVHESTGKETDWIRGLSGREMLSILEKVIELNLTEEVVGMGKKLAGRLTTAMGLELKSQSPALSISSSPKVTA